MSSSSNPSGQSRSILHVWSGPRGLHSNDCCRELVREHSGTRSTFWPPSTFSNHRQVASSLSTVDPGLPPMTSAFAPGRNTSARSRTRWPRPADTCQTQRPESSSAALEMRPESVISRTGRSCGQLSSMSTTTEHTS